MESQREGNKDREGQQGDIGICHRGSRWIGEQKDKEQFQGGEYGGYDLITLETKQVC